MPLPDYQAGSIANLTASLRAALGGRPAHPPLPSLPPEALGARSVVLLVIDGLGYEYLARRPESALYRHLAERLTTVFPSTTASAMTTFLTGLTPQEHGVTGWFMHLQELGTVSAVLPFRPRRGGAEFDLDLAEASRLFGLTPLAEDLPARPVMVTHADLVDSLYSRVLAPRSERIGHDSIDGLFERTLEVLAEGEGRQYVFGYWRTFDGLAHDHGIGSEEVAAHFEAIDAAFGRFVDRLSGLDAAVLLTADHGLVDVPPERIVHLEDHPELLECLALPLCGEPRASYAYVRPGRARAFEDYVLRRLSHCLDVRGMDEIAASGWLGTGFPHPRLAGRIGDYLLLPKEGWAVKDRLAGEKPFAHRGVHGGLSADELYVPLVIARG